MNFYVLDMRTKDNIIQVAETIILKKGFKALSYKNISDKISIQKVLIYEHFTSKDEIGKAVIQKSRLNFIEWCDFINISNLKPVEKLNEFFASYRSLLDDGNKICLAGILGTELNDLPQVIINELRMYYKERQNWLQKLLSEGLTDGTLTLNASLEEESIFILSSLQGGLQITRTNDDKDIFFTICRQLMTQFAKSTEPVMYKV